MNPVAELPLRDIHLPDAVSWWPPAIGWWLLLTLVLLSLVLIYLGIRKLRQPVLKKSARAELAMVVEQYRQQQDTQQLLQALSACIKRIGISYLGREQAAAHSGEDWYQQLNQLSINQKFSDDVIAWLGQGPYQKKLSLNDSQVDQLLNEVEAWLSALPRHKQGVQGV